MPYEPELADQVIEEIYSRADDAADSLEGLLGDEEAIPEEDVMQGLSLVLALRMSAPLFSETWLAGTVLDTADVEPPTLFNYDGEEIEFIQVHYKFATGLSQKKIKTLLDGVDDMEAASEKIWNWVDVEDKGPRTHREKAGGMMYKSQLESGAMVRGMVEVKEKTLEATVNSSSRAGEIQTRLEDILGPLISTPILVRQTVEQAMSEHREESTQAETLDLPPDVEAQLMRDVYDRHYRETLDEPIPMLDNKSPRDAVKTSEGRQKVVAWLKYLEIGEAKNRQSKNTIARYDISWIWHELGISDFRK